jgi:hypothetical protein
MPSLAVKNLRQQGTTGTPPRAGGTMTQVAANGGDSSAAALTRAKWVALGLFGLLVVLHTKGKGE